MHPPPPIEGCAAAGRNRGRSLRVLLALWAVAAVVSLGGFAREAAAHTGAGAGASDPVHIPDANLRAKVEAALNKASGATITHAEMAGMRTCIYAVVTGCLQLMGPYSDRTNVAGRIYDLTGLEHATGLIRLRIRYHPISDLTPIAGLTSLTELHIEYGNVRDLTPIAGLTNLEILRFHHSHRISDLTPLANLTSLRRLDLSVNRISDLAPLAGLTGLTRLFLYDNRISDLTPLAGLVNLDRLFLDRNRVTNVEPLRGMTALTTLRLQENYGLRDISPLSSLTSLTFLDLDATGVEDVQPLVDNSGLGSGDTVSLDDVPTLNDDAPGHFATLRGRGVTVWENLNQQWQVQNVRVTPGPGRLTVTWDPLQDVEYTKVSAKPQGYKVQWRSGAQDWSDTTTYRFAADYADLPGMDRYRVVRGVRTTSYTIPNLASGVTYTVRVKADFGTFYAGAPSAEATGTPLDQITASVTPGAESLDVSWQAVAGATGYHVQWKSDAQEYGGDSNRETQCVPAGQTCVSVQDDRASALRSVPAVRATAYSDANRITYTIENLDSGVTYTVRITPMFANGQGAEYAEVTGTPYRTAIASVTRATTIGTAGSATVAEGEDAELRVVLDEPSEALVTVRWATEDATAEAGEDYRAASGRLTFRPGDKEKTLRVETLDDRRVEPPETFRVRLMEATNAEPDPQAASGTVTITDDDTEAARSQALPMVLAGVGRTLAADAVDVIGRRFAAAPSEAQAVVGGQRLRLDPDGAADMAFGMARVLGVEVNSSAGGSGAWGEPAGPRASAVWRGFDSAAGPWAGTNERTWRRRQVSAAEILAGSRFELPLRNQESRGRTTGWTLWGQGTANGFEGRPRDGLTMDGDVFTGYVGLDYRTRQDVVMGMALAQSWGDVDYETTGVTRGNVDVGLTSLLPYIHWTPRSGLGVWGLLGAGWGDTDLEDEAGKVDSDLEMLLASFGARQELFTWREIDLAMKADAFLTGLEVSAAEGLPKSSGDAQRMRLMLEGRTAYPVSETSQLTPFLELGGRWDRGDAETGVGAELGGGLEFADTELGLSIEARGRYLLAHEESSFDEWGASLTLRLDPDELGGGLWFTMAPVWGARGSRLEEMWSGASGLRSGVGPDDAAAGLSAKRLDLDVGYGVVTHEGGGLLTPYGGVSMGGPGRRGYRLGSRMKLGQAMALGLEGQHETRSGGGRTNSLMLYTRWRW